MRLFLSTLSLRRATSVPHKFRPLQEISIHALLAESDLFLISFDLFRSISIHALLAESDSSASDSLSDTSISIHALLAESDDFKLEENIQRAKFLSTLSLRRATSLASVVFARA